MVKVRHLSPSPSTLIVCIGDRISQRSPGWLGNAILNSHSYLPLPLLKLSVEIRGVTTIPGHLVFFGGGDGFVLLCYCYVIVGFCLVLRQGFSQNPELNQSIQPMSSKDLPVLLFPECIGVIDAFRTA